MVKETLKKFWSFLKEDTWQSWLVSIILVVVVIKFVFFPLLSIVTGTQLPLVVVESCSMYHESSFDEWWANNLEWYESHNITRVKFEEFPFKGGLNKGDIIFVWGRSNYNLGDIIIFTPNSDSNAQHPIIHRLVSTNPLETKGDHNLGQLVSENNKQKIDETLISEDRVIGKAIFRVPLLGWIKLSLFEPFRPAEQRGFCE